MKKLILLILISTSSFFTETTFAQITLSVNISSQPIWGPVGYDYVEYYYFPDIEVYYNVLAHRYVYIEGTHWVSRTYLPQHYRHYNVYSSRKVIINEPKPYLNHKHNVQRYSGPYNHSNQQSIRDSHDSKYFQNKNHPEHYKYKESTKNNHGNDKKNNNHGHKEGNKH